MKKIIISCFTIALTCCIIHIGFAQVNRPVTSSFIGRLGVDTVLVETYSVINNHLYGKSFVRVPEDYIGVFSIHFYPDGSIRELNVQAMDPLNSSIPFKAVSGKFEYRLNMNCRNDSCFFYNSISDYPGEKTYKHAVEEVDFIGGWVPFISLMEWNTKRLSASGKSYLPLKMMSQVRGPVEIGIQKITNDSVIFGGPFLEYTQIKTDDSGAILYVNGVGTPWNYIVTRQPALDVDEIAKRMTKTNGIGNPSPDTVAKANIRGAGIEVKYFSPRKRGRVIFGGIVPYDSVWRTGAGPATVLSVDKSLRFGKTVIPPGKYSIYTIPHQQKWQLIFNSNLTRWPTDPDRSKDFAMVTIPSRKASEKRENFQIRIDSSKKGGELIIAWDDTEAVAAFEVIP
ncbi:DUF2911 domain-containing protein [Pollutibacter soli]|uniref:DUF2911 domain-containing protein n=1 Tax=Pollutibacter soli TaxID=3034157 RepID=UPI003013BF78